jgi:hypothetical protein
MLPMRKQLYVSVGSREVWQEAQEAADADHVSLSDFTALALRDYLSRRRKRAIRRAGQ